MVQCVQLGGSEGAIPASGDLEGATPVSGGEAPVSGGLERAVSGGLDKGVTPVSGGLEGDVAGVLGLERDLFFGLETDVPGLGDTGWSEEDSISSFSKTSLTVLYMIL